MELSESDLQSLREHLSTEAARTAARAAALERDLVNIIEVSADSVRDDEHDPEGATIAFERAQVATLLADARAQMAAIEQATARLAGGEAGRCEDCGGPIGLERLLARPATTQCVTCASRR